MTLLEAEQGLRLDGSYSLCLLAALLLTALVLGVSEVFCGSRQWHNFLLCCPVRQTELLIWQEKRFAVCKDFLHRAE